MVIKSLISIILVFVLTSSLSAQYKFEPVFPGYTGIALLDKLVENYKPITVLDYGSARDTLFSKVYKYKDSLACIYSDYKIALPEGVDPTTFAYMNGSKNGINTEHAYPQSKGAEGGAKSDMNHLFPSKANVNESRGNLPYGESPDNNTQKWYYNTLELTSVPSSNKDLFTELNATVFEPRESVKGNLARAVFYFFTMYKEEALNADPDFFASQVNTLCQWHLQDPVDSLEWERAGIIAKYQGDRKNPFILDCTLPYRTYCPNYLPNCDTTNITSITNISVKPIKVFPNPCHDLITFQLLDKDLSDIKISIFNISGGLVYTGKANSSNSISLDFNKIDFAFAKGFYMVKLEAFSPDNIVTYFTKFIKE